MAKDTKANQSIKSSKRSKAVMTTIIVVCVLIMVGFFVYISGIIPKVVTGIKITETIDGVTNDIENISVLEANYYYLQVMNNWYSNGGLPEDLDAPMAEGQTKTYRQNALDQAADSIRELVVIGRDAERNGFTANSGIERYSEFVADGIRQQAELYGYPSADQYLSRMYGTGMDIRTYRNIAERQSLAQEYEQYARQFLCMPSDEDVLNTFNEDPSSYLIADFNYYYFAGETDDEGNTDLSEALRKANDVIDAATDSGSFKAAVIDQIGEDAAATAGFTEDYDPTYCEGYNIGYMSYYPEALSSFIFEDGEVGEASIVDNGNGVFAVFLADRYQDEETVVSYRTLTLYNDTASDEKATEQQIADALQALQAQANSYGVQAGGDSQAFANLVRQNSELSSEIISGGYTEGIYASQYDDPDGNTLSQSQKELGEWLFDEGRAHGDFYVQTTGNTRVTVYFFEKSETSWQYSVRSSLQSNLYTAWYDNIFSTDTSYAIAYGLITKLAY